MADELLDIGQVARRTGRAPSALRFYERKGLIRLFEPGVLDQVALIITGQDAGFSLDELHELVNGDTTGPEARAMMRRKATEIEQQIERLALWRTRLEHAAQCPAPHLLECEYFLAGVRSALDTDPPALPCDAPADPTAPAR